LEVRGKELGNDIENDVSQVHERSTAGMLSRRRGITLDVTVMALVVRPKTVFGLNFLDLWPPLCSPFVRNVQDVFNEIFDVDEDSVILKILNDRLFVFDTVVSPGMVHITFVGGCGECQRCLGQG
jgi:hypothetical protein